MLLDRLDRARAAVGRGRAADAEQRSPARRRRPRRRSARRCRTWTPPRRRARPRRTSPSPDAAAISSTAVPPSSTSAERRLHRRARAGRARSAATRLAAEREQQRLHRALAAVGERAQVGRHQPGALEPAADRAGDLGGAERALERVGRDEHGALGVTGASCQRASVGSLTAAARGDAARRCEAHATIEQSLRRATQRSGSARNVAYCPPSCSRVPQRPVPVAPGCPTTRARRAPGRARRPRREVEPRRPRAARRAARSASTSCCARSTASRAACSPPRCASSSATGSCCATSTRACPARVEYELSDTGEALLMALAPLLDWGKLHQARSPRRASASTGSSSGAPPRPGDAAGAHRAQRQPRVPGVY